ncbi:hypothetical protein [Aminobacter phage Erebus]|nr:hypothetical protein [Aminobacter phage Erebus]
MVQLNFNAAGVKPNVALEAVPSGMYPVIITRSEEKPTKAGTGSYIELEMTIQSGEFQGRKVFDRLNIRNQNQVAVDIAYATLSAICHVTGRLQIQDTSQLHGAPFIAVVAKLPRDDRPDTMTNEVKGYKDINGNDPGFAGNAGAQSQAAPTWAQGQQTQQQQQQPAQQQTQQVQQPVQQQQVQQPVQQMQTQPVQTQQVQQQPQTAGNTAPPWVQNAGGAVAAA